MTIDINLPWQSFNVDLSTIHTWMQANAGPDYCGLSANSQLQAHFTAEPGDDIRSAVISYWAALSNSSPEATNYMSETNRRAAADAAKTAKIASATAKLEALGLTTDEIAAIIG